MMFTLWDFTAHFYELVNNTPSSEDGLASTLITPLQALSMLSADERASITYPDALTRFSR